METPEELPNKPKLFFIHAVEHWDAEFYVKVNDDIYVNIGMKSMLFTLLRILYFYLAISLCFGLWLDHYKFIM